MIRFVLAVLCCAGIAIQILWTTLADRFDQPRDHVEAPTHVRVVRWAIVDEDEAS